MFCLDHSLFIGITTRQRLSKLFENGDVSDREVDQFHNAVRGFYCKATAYVLANLPFHDSVIQNSDFDNRENVNISQVIFLSQGTIQVIYISIIMLLDTQICCHSHLNPTLIN